MFIPLPKNILRRGEKLKRFPQTPSKKRVYDYRHKLKTRSNPNPKTPAKAMKPEGTRMAELAWF
jgi:hypothetical protein